MSSEDPVESVAAGAAKGTLEWTVEKIASLAKRFINRNLVFIEDQDTISAVKDSRRSPEWLQYHQQVHDGKLRLLVQMGLALRRLESSPSRLQSLRNKINAKYGTEGLRIAEFVQNEALNNFVAHAIAKSTSPEDVRTAVETLLRNVDKYVIFVKSDDDANKKAKEIVVRLQAQLPKNVILLGSGSAIGVAVMVTSKILKEVSGYEVAKYEEAGKMTFILTRSG